MMKSRTERWLCLQRTDQAVAECGQTATEYAVVLAVLLIAVGTIVMTLQGSIESFITDVGDKIATIIS